MTQKYFKWYSDICSRGAERISLRVPKSDHEDHHIVPKAHGGTNAKSNIARLTPREHFVAHLLLYRIHKDQPMALALWLMSNCGTGKVNAKKYAELRKTMGDVGRKSIALVNNDLVRKDLLNKSSSQFMRDLWKSEEYRANRADCTFPTGFHEAQTLRAKKLWEREGLAEKLDAARKKHFSCPENKARASKKMSASTSRRNKEEGLASKGGQAAKLVITKNVRCIETGVTFYGLKAAANWLIGQTGRKVSIGNISSVCTGKLKTAYGYTWEHA
jgi:hypothetical protein